MPPYFLSDLSLESRQSAAPMGEVLAEEKAKCCVPRVQILLSRVARDGEDCALAESVKVARTLKYIKTRSGKTRSGKTRSGKTRSGKTRHHKTRRHETTRNMSEKNDDESLSPSRI